MPFDASFREVSYQLRRHRLAHVNVKFGFMRCEVPDDRAANRVQSLDHADAQSARSRSCRRRAQCLQLIKRSAGCRGRVWRPLLRIRKPDVPCPSLTERAELLLQALICIDKAGWEIAQTSAHVRNEHGAPAHQIAKLPERHGSHQNILFQQSIESTLPDARRSNSMLPYGIGRTTDRRQHGPTIASARSRAGSAHT